MMTQPVAVGLGFRKERRNYVGRKKWMEEELSGAKGNIVSAPRNLQICGTVMAPSTFVNAWVRMCAFPVCSTGFSIGRNTGCQQSSSHLTPAQIY